MNIDDDTSRASFQVLSYAATVFLIGGQMTLQDGSVIDSRQSISGDPADYLLHQAMSRSEDWWKAAKELADLIMDDSRETDWTLAWAPKSVSVVKPDGTLGRRQIRSVLGLGSTNFIEFEQQARDEVAEEGKIVSQELIQEHPAISANHSQKQPNRYRFFTHGLQDVDQIAPEERPSVFIGSYHTMCSPLEEVLSELPDTVIILPHTSTVERLILNGSIRPTRYDAKRTDEAEAGGLRQDPSFGCLDNGYSFEESERAFKKKRFYIATAEFSITRFVSRDATQDPAVAQSAVHFIRTNYDLRIGFWDLVNNPGLRDILLDKMPTSAAPSGKTSLPVESARGVKQSSLQKSARKVLHDRIAPSLSPHWKSASWNDEGSNYFLPFGNVIDGLPQGRNHLVTLHLTVHKRQMILHIEAFSGYESKVKRWIQNRQGILNALGLTIESPKQPNQQILGRFNGCGWGDHDEEEISAMVKKIGTLTDLAIEDFQPRQNSSEQHGRPN